MSCMRYVDEPVLVPTGRKEKITIESADGTMCRTSKGLPRLGARGRKACIVAAGLDSGSMPKANPVKQERRRRRRKVWCRVRHLVDLDPAPPPAPVVHDQRHTAKRCLTPHVDGWSVECMVTCSRPALNGSRGRRATKRSCVHTGAGSRAFGSCWPSRNRTEGAEYVASGPPRRPCVSRAQVKTHAASKTRLYPWLAARWPTSAPQGVPSSAHPHGVHVPSTCVRHQAWSTAGSWNVHAIASSRKNENKWERGEGLLRI